MAGAFSTRLFLLQQIFSNRVDFSVFLCLLRRSIYPKAITDIGANYSVPMSVIFYVYFFLRLLSPSCAAISANSRFFSALTCTMSSDNFPSTSSRVLA